MALDVLSRSARRFTLGALIVAALAFAGGVLEEVRAQDGVLSPGDAIITQFSGLTSGPTGTPLPDPNGATVKALSLGSPGFPANGSVWPTPPLILSLTAADTGQVFGSAFDDAEPANAYLAASSVYGLYRSPTGDGWADGMWGPDGGPGTIWKLDAANNYTATPFANLLGEDGTENGGAGVGGIAFDPWNRQLLASDLETGLIHRISLDTGETVQTFDHGLDGRSYFLDVPSGEYLVLDVVPDSTETVPRFDDCTDANGNSAAFSETPDCWNYADFRRRVFGLGVQRDPITDTIRLYYAVWGGAALGSEDWDTAGDDAATSIWSVRLDGNGGFDLTDVRREFVVPPLIPEEEGEGPFEAPPVTDITFSTDGTMLIAERGRPAPDFDATPPMLVEPDSARVLQFIRNDDGIWESEGRYDVGFPERQTPPRIRANASGGVALGDGFTAEGALDPEAEDGTVWMSGDPLCAPGAPCVDHQTGEATVSGPLAGFQGTPVAATGDLVPPAAAQSGAGAATAPDGPLGSYFVGDGSTSIVGAMGDIAIYRGEPVSQIVETIEPDADVLEEYPEEALQPEQAVPDIAVAKTGLGQCAPGGQCQFEISVTNTGVVDYYGPVVLTDTIGQPGVSLIDAGPEPWVCFSAGGGIYCQLPTQYLAPGESTAFTLTLGVPADYSIPRLDNCVAITWLGLQGRDRIRAVQAALTDAGFATGSVDGIMGPQTASAIREAEASVGLPQTGEITSGIVEAFFGEGADQDGDASPANDQDCGLIGVDVPAPPSHLVQASSFHRRFDSVNHDPVTSAPIDFHDTGLSVFHRTWRSSLHDGVTSQPIPYHRVALSQFHLTWGSAFHDSVYTSFVPLHTVGLSNFHGTNRSILHNYRTSTILPSHRYQLSGFHRSWNSARHDGIVTRVAPLHWVQLSAFHRRFSSGVHDRAVTRVRPVHNRSVSNFHNFNQSSLHDPLTSRVRPIHRGNISAFHRNGVSALHNPATSNRRPGHVNTISTFHRSFVSSQHVSLTSRVRPVHNPSVSQFHSNNASALHVARTSGRRTQHLGTLSQFHRNNASGAHNRASSNSRPIHSQGPSTFHQTGRSQLHNAATSRARTVHAPAVSSFHRNQNSGQHRAGTSRAISPAHAVGLSNFHRSGQSGAHNTRNSTGVSPSHQPAVSSFHRNRNSGQHNSRTSKAVSPAHNPAQSNAALRSGGPSHAPAVSRSRTTPSHNPAKSSGTTRSGGASSKASPTPRTPAAPKTGIHGQARSNAKASPARPAHSTAASTASRRPPAQRPGAGNKATPNRPSATRPTPKAPAARPQTPKAPSTRQPKPKAPAARPQAPKPPAARPQKPKAPAARQQPPQRTTPKAKKPKTAVPKQPGARTQPKARQPVQRKPATRQQPKARQPVQRKPVTRQQPPQRKQPAARTAPKKQPAARKPQQRQTGNSKKHNKKTSQQLQNLRR